MVMKLLFLPTKLILIINSVVFIYGCDQQSPSKFFSADKADSEVKILRLPDSVNIYSPNLELEKRVPREEMNSDKMTVFFVMGYCSKCVNLLVNLETLIEDLTNKHNVDILIFIESNDFSWIKDQLRIRTFDFPVVLDSKKEFRELNHLGFYSSSNYYLINRNKEILRSKSLAD